jgi:hypothetical protein
MARYVHYNDARPEPCPEATLKGSKFLNGIFRSSMFTFIRSTLAPNRRTVAVKACVAALAVVCVVALAARAQSGMHAIAQRTVASPYQGEEDGVNVGGKWFEFRSEEKMTGHRIARFELQSDNYLSVSPDYKPRIELVCSNRKYEYADFNPGMPLGPPNRPGFWGQPQIEVMVRVDDTHHYHGWNWIRGRFLSMDKGTARELIGSHIFKVQIPGRRGPEIAEFSPAGLDLARVHQDCDLKPKKPSQN